MITLCISRIFNWILSLPCVLCYNCIRNFSIEIHLIRKRKFMLKKAVTPGSFLKNYLFTLLIVFLPLFMFGVFGPSEIFFGNYSEFGFIYREFGWKFLGISVVLALFIALILQIVPKFPRTLILSVLWGFTIAGYIQTMFLNKSLDRLGYLLKDIQPMLHGSSWMLYSGLLSWLHLCLSVFSKKTFVPDCWP